MKTFKTLLTTLFVAGLAASAYAGGCADCSSSKSESTTPDVSLDVLKTAVTEGSVTLIDVNGTQSYTAGHIPGAIDFQAVGKEGLVAFLPQEKDALIVAYCGGPGCAAYKKAVDAATELGYTNVQHFSGGLKGWKEAGQATKAVAG
ncbi:MAG: rhodanese-like domain-containing protein [Verrucomicrobiota bacterium]